METKEKKQSVRRVREFGFLFPLALLYYEITFRLFTGGSLLRLDTLLLIPLCCAYGGIGTLLCTLSSSRRVNFWLTAALLLLLAVPYGVEAFLYREFGIFYNFKAIFTTTGDVVGNFGSEVVRLIFSLRGLFCIAVYLLPTVLFALRGSAPCAVDGRTRGMTAARVAAFYVLSVLVIHAVPKLDAAYSTEYTFQTSVERFGLLTGAGLDAREQLLGRSTPSFEQVDMGGLVTGDGQQEPSADPGVTTDSNAASDPGVTADPDAAADPGVTPVPSPVPSYGQNVLDLPLDAETASTTDEFRELNAYVAGLTPSMKNQYTGLFEGKNLIMITAEAFTRDVIDPDLTPTLYRMYTKGVHFSDYYQFAGSGTIGGEYQHIFGLLPSHTVDSVLEMVKHRMVINLPSELYLRGYYGVAYHNGEYDFYDRDKSHPYLGFSDGFYAFGNGLEDIMGTSWDSCDDDLFESTVPTYIDRQPFSVYYMTLSGHAPYGTENDHWEENKDRVADLPYSDMVKGYLGSNLDLEDAMTYLIGELEAKGIADDTVICMTGDHYPYGLADGNDYTYVEELYGSEVKTDFDRDHNCWLLWSGCLEDQEPIVVDSPTFSLDILPTMLNLFGIDFDSRLLPGRDVFSDAPALVFDMGYNWRTDYGQYIASEGVFTPNDESVALPSNYVENMKTVVRNKINYCDSVLSYDYFGYLFFGV